MGRLRVIGGRVLLDGALVDAHVRIEGGRIVAVERRDGAGTASDTSGHVFDARDCIVAPGFIDLQVNGGYGIDLAREPERCNELGARLVDHGVTAWLPTLVSSDPPTRAGFLGAVRSAAAHPQADAAPVLGAHLEGPVLAPTHAGAHRVENLQPAAALVAELDELDGVALLTLAPELPGALELVEAAVARGIVVSIGHTAAPAEIVHQAADAGATYATHLFNAMGGLHHRAPGPAGAVLADERFRAGLILDGHHLHDDTVRMAWQILGPRRASLVSDATSALGRAPGRAALGDQAVTVEAEAVRTPAGALAGTCCALDQALRNLVAVAGCPLAQALQTVTAVPARLLGQAGRGVIAEGAVADLVVLTDQADVVATVVSGRVVRRQAT